MFHLNEMLTWWLPGCNSFSDLLTAHLKMTRDPFKLKSLLFCKFVGILQLLRFEFKRSRFWKFLNFHLYMFLHGSSVHFVFLITKAIPLFKIFCVLVYELAAHMNCVSQV